MAFQCAGGSQGRNGNITEVIGLTAETENVYTAAEALYRFFAAFDGFDAQHPLGFEAESPGERQDLSGVGIGSPAAEMASVFTMEPMLTRVRQYVNGSEVIRGACTVSGRVRENDGAKRHETAAFFSSLAAYVRTYGECFEDDGRIYVIRPAAHPVRVMMTSDGAVWELRCTAEIYEKQG